MVQDDPPGGQPTAHPGEHRTPTPTPSDDSIIEDGDTVPLIGKLNVNKSQSLNSRVHDCFQSVCK